MAELTKSELRQMHEDGDELTIGGKPVKKRHLREVPEVPKTDPLESMARKLIEIGKQSEGMTAMVMKSMNEMISTLSKIGKTPVKEPEVLKEWKHTAVRTDNKTVIITSKQVK